MSRSIWGLTALILMGCPNGNPHTDDTDTGTDTDTDDPSQMARLTVNVTLLGTPEPCLVRLDGETIGPSGQELEVDPGSYQLTVGSDEMTADSLPIHRDAENVPWVAVPADIALAAQSDKVEEVPLNRYFNAPFNCVEERYDYDASASDLKGDHDDTVYLDEIVLTVENGQYVPGDSNWIIGDGSGLIISGNSLTLETSTDTTMRDGVITMADNGDTVFTLTLMNERFGFVSDVTCEEE